MNMESISIYDRVAPIAKSPLDSARGRRRTLGKIHISQDDITERMNEHLRELQFKSIFNNKVKQSVFIK